MLFSIRVLLTVCLITSAIAAEASAEPITAIAEYHWHIPGFESVSIVDNPKDAKYLHEHVLTFCIKKDDCEKSLGIVAGSPKDGRPWSFDNRPSHLSKDEMLRHVKRAMREVHIEAHRYHRP